MTAADLAAYWADVKARSLSADGKTFCATCSISFTHGAWAEGKPLPCPKHATDEEKARASRMMNSKEFRDGLERECAPLLALIRKNHEGLN
jgi:hypothetical protein